MKVTTSNRPLRIIALFVLFGFNYASLVYAQVPFADAYRDVLGFNENQLTPLLREMQIIRHSGSQQFGKTAMPWFDEGVYNPAGSEFLAHGGGGFGNLAFVAFDKKKHRGLIILTNQMVINPYVLGWTILQGMPLRENNFAVREVMAIGTALDTDSKTGLPRITTVFPKSPAGEIGLSAGLLILRVNGSSTEGKTPAECMGLMKGPAGTKVRLEVMDAESKATRTVEITKQKFLTAIDDFRD